MLAHVRLCGVDLHPDCRPLAFLLGTWKGRGEGHYPTIESFTYLEEVSFGHVGKPFLAYNQKTRHGETGEPLHAEAGYLRATGERDDARSGIELVLTQPSGIVEVHTGYVEGQRLQLNLHTVLTTPTAKSVTNVTRDVRVESTSGADASSAVLHYDLAMAAVGEPLTHHLRAALTQQTAEP